MEGNPVYGDTARNGTTLAHRPDFSLGNATIRPSLCQVEGPAGTVTTEPRVMEVLVTFADAGGAVLTRDDLMQACWRGAVVSDDAINRTIREARRAARATGADFGIDNIPRVGYRLTGAGMGSPPRKSRLRRPQPAQAHPPAGAGCWAPPWQWPGWEWCLSWRAGPGPRLIRWWPISPGREPACCAPN
jgi:DNA-binding winged helix-turn-helix (wHTH) protein